MGETLTIPSPAEVRLVEASEEDGKVESADDAL
jgi:hypothetical protein